MRRACLLFGAPTLSLARQRAEAQEPQEPAGAEEAEEAPVEAEFVASTIFQGGTVALRLRSPLTLEGHYFGVEDNEIGVVGLAWTFTHRALRVVPGLGWAFGSENRPAPVVTVRWSYEAERWLTQGLWVQSLRAYLPAQPDEHEDEAAAEGEAVRHASILDGIHVSARIGRLEVDPLVEHIQYREEREWKGGARVAWRVGAGLKIVGQVLGPGAEARAGLAWEP